MSDDSVKILQRYASEYPQFSYVTQKNSGPGAAFNRALLYAEKMRFEYIARMDADDISLPYRTRKQVAVLEADANIATCGSCASYFTGQKFSCGQSVVSLDSESIKSEIYAGGRGVIQGSATFRTSALLEIGGYRADKTPAEDTDIFLRLAERFPLANIPDVAYRIRICGSSHSLDDIYLTRLYHHYYLKISRLRRHSETEIFFGEYVEHLSLCNRMFVWRESLVIASYFKWMTERFSPSLLLSVVLEPERVVRRIHKIFQRVEQ